MISGAFIRRAVACSLIAGLAGCGGGSNTGSVPPPGETPVAGVTSGIAVDPYIEGAMFEEYVDGVPTGNRSSASDASGKFTFTKAPAQGSTIQMIVPGLHNGAPYSGTLKRKVDATTGDLVSSPITTLLAEGVSEEDLAAALGVAIGALKSNPMAGIDKGGDINEADLNLLKASILAHAALKNPGMTLTAAVAIVQPIVDKLTAAEYKANPTIINSVVAMRDYLLEAKAKGETIAPADRDAVFEQVKTAYQNGDVLVTIVKDDSGQFVVGGGGATAPLPTANDYFIQAMAALQTGLAASGDMTKVQEAAYKFKAAEVSIDTTTLQADKDAILFFSAFSQLAALADTASGDGTGLNRLGDLLDAFGVAKDGRNLFQMIELPQDCQPANYGGYSFMECNQLPLPATTPTTGAIQAFLSGKFAPQLQAVVTSLGKVSSSFNYSWADPGDVTPTEIDHADVLIFKAVAQGILGQLNIQAAYNVDVDLYAQERQDATGTDTPQAFLERNPDLGKLVDVAKLTQAKTFLSAGLTDMENALAAIKAETDDQMDDLIAFYSPADMTMAEEDLALAKAALVGEVTLPGTTSRINAAKFFSPGVNLRANLPVFTGDVPGMFPDATFGGILSPEFDLNADLDGDGSPDMLSDFSQFSYGVLAQNSAWAGNFWAMDMYGYLNLDGTDTASNTDDTFQAQLYPNNAPSIDLFGTWKVVNDQLVLTTPQEEVITLTLSDGFGTYLDVSWSSSTGSSGWGNLYGGSGGGGGIASAPLQ